MIDPISDIVDKHNDVEIIQYLYKQMLGINKAYRNALAEKSPEYLWSVVGDLAQVTMILGKMNSRNQERLAEAKNA